MVGVMLGVGVRVRVGHLTMTLNTPAMLYFWVSLQIRLCLCVWCRSRPCIRCISWSNCDSARLSRLVYHILSNAHYTRHWQRCMYRHVTVYISYDLVITELITSLYFW